jgi:hypothetical protein
MRMADDVLDHHIRVGQAYSSIIRTLGTPTVEPSPHQVAEFAGPLPSSAKYIVGYPLEEDSLDPSDPNASVMTSELVIAFDEHNRACWKGYNVE